MQHNPGAYHFNCHSGHCTTLCTGAHCLRHFQHRCPLHEACKGVTARVRVFSRRNSRVRVRVSSSSSRVRVSSSSSRVRVSGRSSRVRVRVRALG